MIVEREGEHVAQNQRGAISSYRGATQTAKTCSPLT